MPTAGRIWFATISALVMVAIGLQISVTATLDTWFDSVAARIANLFTFFTIQSNLLVGAAALGAALERGRAAAWRRALWVAALLAIAVTAIVYHAVLAGFDHPSRASAMADALLHTAIPALFGLGWLVFGPRGVVGVRSVLLSLIFPLTWLALTLVRGALAGYYPYPFLDVRVLGYAAMAGNVALIATLYVTLALALRLVDAARARLAAPGKARRSRRREVVV